MSKYIDISEVSEIRDDFLEVVKVHVTVRTKPCPLCGSPAEKLIIQDAEGYEHTCLSCTKCGFRTAGYEGLAEAGGAWNNRKKQITIRPKKYRDCPLCGGIAAPQFSDDPDKPDGFYLECQKCGARGKVYDTLEQATKDWGHRAI